MSCVECAGACPYEGDALLMAPPTCARAQEHAMGYAWSQASFALEELINLLEVEQRPGTAAGVRSLVQRLYVLETGSGPLRALPTELRMLRG